MRIMFIVNDLGINEPFGPMILSAILKERGHKTTLGVLKKEDVLKKILLWKPDMLAYSMMSVDMPDMREFNYRLRKKMKIFTLLGGIHATIDRNCIKDTGVDAVCVGEGEDAIVDIIQHLDKGKSLEGIPNIVVAGQEYLRLRNLIDNFDAYPFMDRELVYAYPDMRRFGVKGIWTSRGCAFRCPYCFNNRYNELFKNNGKKVRRRSVDSVIRETKELASQYRVDFIRIQDDIFVYKVDAWLKDFVRRWVSEVRLPLYCLLRCESVTDEMAFYLKEAGCSSVCMSIEAADDDVRINMMRRKENKEHLENAFLVFKKYKINIYANTILALPFTTLQYDIASLDLAIKLQPEMPNFSIFMPYAGTDLADYCSQTGIYDANSDAITYGMRNISPLACFSQKEKEAQYNLCELGIVAVKFPRLRNLIVKHLIYWKPNKIFFLVHYLFAVVTYGRKIFYFKHRFSEYIELIARTLKHYLYDYTNNRRNNTPLSLKKPVKSVFPGLKAEERIAKLTDCLNAMST